MTSRAANSRNELHELGTGRLLWLARRFPKARDLKGYRIYVPRWWRSLRESTGQRSSALEIRPRRLAASVLNPSWHCGEKALAFPLARSLRPALTLSSRDACTRVATRRLCQTCVYVCVCVCVYVEDRPRTGGGRTSRPHRATYDARLRAG